MNEILEMNESLKRYAEKVPAKGTHLDYLNKAVELMEVYGKAVAIMHDDRTPENEGKVKAIAKEIKQIVG